MSDLLKTRIRQLGEEKARILRGADRLSAEQRKRISEIEQKIADLRGPKLTDTAPDVSEACQTLDEAVSSIGANFGKDPRFKLSRKKYVELKKYVFDRDGWCVFCGRFENSTPAHVIRRSQGGGDRPNNLVRACVRCHERFDKYEIEIPESVREMLENEPEVL